MVITIDRHGQATCGCWAISSSGINTSSDLLSNFSATAFTNGTIAVVSAVSSTIDNDELRVDGGPTWTNFRGAKFSARSNIDLH